MFGAALALENFSEGFAGTALIAWMSSLTTFGYAATQYALLSSFYAILGKILKGLSGVAVETLDRTFELLIAYGVFFAITASIAVPSVLVALWAARVHHAGTVIEVRDLVAEAHAAALELRRWTHGERFAAERGRRRRFELRARGEHLASVARVVGPVRRDVQQAARLQHARELGDERRLHEPPFVVALLRPRIREEQVDGVEASARQQLGHDVGRVARDHAHVRDGGLLEQQQQVTDAGLVHLDAEVVDRRVVQGVRDERFAVTEADVQHAPRGAAEQLVEVEPPGRLGDAEARQQLGKARRWAAVARPGRRTKLRTLRSRIGAAPGVSMRFLAGQTAGAAGYT